MNDGKAEIGGAAAKALASSGASLAWQRAKDLLTDLRAAHLALSGGADDGERALASVAESVGVLESWLAAAERIGDGMQSSLAVKERDPPSGFGGDQTLTRRAKPLGVAGKSAEGRGSRELDRLADTLFEDVELLLQSRRWRGWSCAVVLARSPAGTRATENGRRPYCRVTASLPADLGGFADPSYRPRRCAGFAARSGEG